MTRGDPRDPAGAPGDALAPAPDDALAPAPGDALALAPAPGDADLPVVARLVVEVRSDGRRTVARGAVVDVATGQRVAVEARGASPAQLAFALARSLWQMPRLARRVRGLLGRGKTDRRR